MYRIPDTCNHFIQESICKHKGKNLNAWVQVPTGNQWQKKKKSPPHLIGSRSLNSWEAKFQGCQGTRCGLLSSKHKN